MNMGKSSREFAITIRILATLFAILFFGQSAAQPIPVRNDVPGMGQQEVVMMCHAYLDDGGYQHWYEQSSSELMVKGLTKK